MGRVLQTQKKVKLLCIVTCFVEDCASMRNVLVDEVCEQPMHQILSLRYICIYEEVTVVGGCK